MECRQLSSKENDLHYYSEVSKKITELIKLIETLRGKNGCPWDQKQTPRSISIYLIEEMYELVEAIIRKDSDDICEELGDVLFHILFIAALYKEQDSFNLEQVIARITQKMIRRHPHVFGDIKVENVEDVKKQWHHIKQSEKKNGPTSSILSSVPKSLPALIRSYRISERAARSGFDWDDIKGVMEKVEEEWKEFKSEMDLSPEKEINLHKKSLEFGDILFTLMNVARFAGIHPETALAESTNKFEKRFKFMETEISKKGKQFESISRIELNQFWEQAKQIFQD